MHSSQFKALAQELDEFGTVCLAYVTFPHQEDMPLQGWLVDSETDVDDYEFFNTYGIHMFSINDDMEVSFQASTHGLTRERAFELFSQNVKHAKVFVRNSVYSDKHYRRPEPYRHMCACGELFNEQHLADLATKTD